MIPQYTLASVLALGIALGMNYRYNPHFKNQKLVFFTLGIATVSQLVFDNLTVWRGFWFFNETAILGVRMPFMPIENLFFGISLFLVTVLLWEKFKPNQRTGN